MSFNLNRFSIILVIVLPIVAELFRKYIFYSNVWLIILDVILLIIFVRTLFKYKPPIIFNLWLLVLLIFTIHGVIFSLINDRQPFSLLFGLRTSFYPLVGFLIASSINFDKDISNQLIKIVLLLAILIAGFGAAQIIIDPIPWGGEVHWINYVPSEIEYGRSLGFGGFDQKVNDAFPMINLYRPHSIFLHTGKFGQVIWGLSALLLVLARDLTPNKRAILMILIILLNIITFQRAALYPLILFMFIYFYAFSNHKLKLTFALALMSLIIFLSDSEVIYTVLQRFFSALPEIPERLEAVLFSSGALLDNGLIGDGWGYYATGASILGGGNYSDHFGGEGGWIIMAAELGIPIAFSLFMLIIVIGTIVFLRSISEKNDRYLCFWAGFIILLIPVWAGTHNIFGSYIMMLYTSIPIGLYFNKSFNLKLQDNLF